MGLFFWGVSLIVPLVATVMGLIFRFRPPRKINMVFGYRTTRSMASQEAWNMAHEIGGRLWIITGLALIAVSIAANLAVPLAPEVLMMALLILDLICVAAPLPYVESKLKEKFGK